MRTRTNVFEHDKKAFDTAWSEWTDWEGEQKKKNKRRPIRIILSIHFWGPLMKTWLQIVSWWWQISLIWNSKQYLDSERNTTCSFFALSSAHTHALTQTESVRPTEKDRATHTDCYLWRMRQNFKNPWAINQSQPSRTVWQSAHIIGRQAHIRYAFSRARSKLESQLTLLIALSHLILKTMGIEEEAFTISSSCHHSESLRLPSCFHFN